MATEKTPHGLSPSAFTTTRARIATMMTMMVRVAIRAAHAADEAEFLAGHLAQRAAAAAHREEQHQVVLHRPGQDHADDDPECAGQVAPLRGEHRADERTGAGDRGEVVAVEHTPVHRHVVLAVLVVLGGRRAPVVRLRDLLLDVGRVEAVGDEVGAHGGEDEPDRVDRLARGPARSSPRPGRRAARRPPTRRSAAASTCFAARREARDRPRPAAGSDRRGPDRRRCVAVRTSRLLQAARPG